MLRKNRGTIFPRDDSQIKQDLIKAYDRAVDQRDRLDASDWKTQEREKFLQLLHAERKSSLVDIGSGPGVHATYFQEQGIEVTCVDLSPAMVARCKEKGLEAYVSDVMHIESLGKALSAAFAMNSLLHLPREQIQPALMAIRNILTPDGLFYWGQYGGEEHVGPWRDDEYEPKRFFSLLDDEHIKEEATRIFRLEEFTQVHFNQEESIHFQALILRVKER
jgi:SAM-dependent methyltransferase